MVWPEGKKEKQLKPLRETDEGEYKNRLNECQTMMARLMSEFIFANLLRHMVCREAFVKRKPLMG